MILSVFDTALIGVICAMVGAMVTSVVWSHAAFARYTEISERLAVLETKMDISIARHEQICLNFKPGSK